MPTHAQKIEAALVSYLNNLSASVGTWPDTLNDSAGNKRIFSGEDNATKDGQCIICVMDDMQEEFPEQSGNRYSLCRVELRTPVESVDSGTEPLDEHVAAAEVLETALLQDDLTTQLTGAIADFTAMGVLDRQPIQEATENYWMTGYTFRLYSCPKAFS